MIAKPRSAARPARAAQARPTETPPALTPDQRPETPAADASAGARLHALEQAVQHAVEEAITTTERSVERRGGRRLVRALHLALKTTLIAAVVAYFAFGALLLATRYVLLPRIDQARPWLEQQASAAFGAQLTIGRIEADWRGLHPRLALSDVRLARGDSADLALAQVDAELSWASLLRLAPHFRSLSVSAPSLEVQRLDATRFALAGFEIDVAAPVPARVPLLDWLLDQRQVTLRDARIDYIDRTRSGPDGAPAALAFDGVQLTLLGGFNSTRLALQANPPPQLAARIDLRAEFRHGWFKPASAFSEWHGRAYVDLEAADLARAESIARLLPPSMRIERAHGALRAWVEIDRARLQRLTADLALADVRALAGEGLAPLELESLRARLVSREWGNVLRGGHELQLQGLTLQGANIVLPPTELRLRSTRGSAGEPGTRDGARAPRTEFEANRISLDALTQLAAHVPLARDLRSRIARQDLRGTLHNVRLDVDGDLAAPDRYALRADFEGLSSSGQSAQPEHDAAGWPRAGLPGFANLRGTVDLTEAGGRLEVDARQASLEFPGVFRQPRLDFDRLSAQLRWSRSGEQLQVWLQSLAAANADLELAAGGSYQRRLPGDGPGTVDLTARVAHLDVAAAPRYVPLVTGPYTSRWLAQALIGGRATDGTIRLKGDLADFPFRDPRRGEFRAAIRVRDGELNYVPAYTGADGREWPAWPALEAIDADVVFDRAALTVTARSASIYGTRVTNALAHIDDLEDADARLTVRGSTRGPAADLLRYARDSGLRESLAFLAGARASGEARLDLRLEIPLVGAYRTAVGGAIQLAGNDIVLRDDLLPFTRASGRIEFTRHTLALSNLSAGFAGGQLSASALTRPDGTFVVTGSGSATPAAVARQVEFAPVQRLLARAQGSARYTGTLSVRGDAVDLRLESDLAGWTIDAPAPLAKAAAEVLPLRLELLGLGGERERIAVAAGNALALRLERARQADGSLQLSRGALGVGAAAPLPARGMVARIDLPTLDLDAWQALLAAPAASAIAQTAPAPADFMPDQVSLRARELLVAGKSISNIAVDASRTGTGAKTLWTARVGADQIEGEIDWRPGVDHGKLSARLARLAIGEDRRTQVADLFEAPAGNLPDLDLIAERFELEGRPLGRLELQAANDGAPLAPEWNLHRLALTTPEARLNASGRWLRAQGQPARHTALKFALEFDDAGALLARFGVPEALRGGRGRLEGDLTWRGVPLAIHTPTLAGSLRLDTSRGQFLRADAGAARLLGVLSLQALPRRITLDFRDVFSEGFAFDSVTATAEVAAGVLSTRDLRMRGTSASVLLEGNVDLERETQNLHVLVLPAVDAGSATLAYAMLANPAIGLGAFVAQMLLRDPLSKAFSFEYDITGTWDDPQVKRRPRAVVEQPSTGLN